MAIRRLWHYAIQAYCMAPLTSKVQESQADECARAALQASRTDGRTLYVGIDPDMPELAVGHRSHNGPMSEVL